MMRSSALVVLLLSLAFPGCAADDEAARRELDRLVAGTQDPGDRVRILIFGGLSEQQTAESLPAPYWSRTRLFRVVNYTWPHCPGATVALTDENEALPLSGISDGVGDLDALPLGAFNRVAAREGRTIAPGEAVDYLRFVLQCYVGNFEPERFLFDAASARRAAGGESIAGLGGFGADVPLRHQDGHYLLDGYYADYGRVHALHLDVRARDGTVTLRRSDFPG